MYVSKKIYSYPQKLSIKIFLQRALKVVENNYILTEILEYNEDINSLVHCIDVNR